MSRRLDALIVGAGPAGLACLRLLQAAGLEAEAIDRQAERATPDGRAYALSPAVIDALDAIGVWSRVAESARCDYRHMVVWALEDVPPLRFSAASLSLPRLGSIVGHEALVAALCGDGQGVHRGVGLRALEIRPDAVRAALDDGTTVHARLLIGADGAQSSVRSLAGIGVAQWSYRQRAIVCDLDPAGGHRDTAWQRFAPDGTLGVLPRPQGRCSIVWSVPESRADALLALSDEAFCEACSQALHGRLGVMTQPSPRRAFPLQAQRADAMRSGRVLLIGDAAHVIHPLAGQGLNLGIGDALDLAARIRRAQASGRAFDHPRVLAAWERARRARSDELLALTDALARAFAVGTRPWQRLLATGMAAIGRLAPLRDRLAAEAVRA